MVESTKASRYTCAHEEPIKRSTLSGYCLNVESIVKPQFEKSYDDLIVSHSANSRLEPACLQFDWGKADSNESSPDATHYYFHEEYTDRAGFEAHTQTPHFGRFVKFNNEKEPYVVPQIVDFYEIINYMEDTAGAS